MTENTDPQTLERLKSLEKIQNGAELSQLDLKLRGPGSLFGTLQHGIQRLKAASYSDTDLIIKTKKAAEQIYPNLKNYPTLYKIIQENISHNSIPD